MAGIKDVTRRLRLFRLQGAHSSQQRSPTVPACKQPCLHPGKPRNRSCRQARKAPHPGSPEKFGRLVTGRLSLCNKRSALFRSQVADVPSADLPLIRPKIAHAQADRRSATDVP